MYKRALIGVLAFGLAACSSSPNASTAAKTSDLAGLSGQIGSKDFAEQYILAHLTTKLLNAHGATLEANTKLVGSANVRQALENKQFVGYWEYTGTSWITYNKQTQPLKTEQEQFDAVKKADEANNIAWVSPAKFNNTYTFAIRNEKARELGVSKMSDIAKLPANERTFCIESEFSTRDDGWPGVSKTYGFDAPKDNVKLLDTGVIYTATKDGKDCNFGEVFATDGRIAALGLTVLQDDKAFFPIYQGGFTLQADVLKNHPKIADVLKPMADKLTTEEMQKLNAKVDVDGDEPDEVAQEWLTAQGLI